MIMSTFRPRVLYNLKVSLQNWQNQTEMKFEHSYGPESSESSKISHYQLHLSSVKSQKLLRVIRKVIINRQHKKIRVERPPIEANPPIDKNQPESFDNEGEKKVGEEILLRKQIEFVGETVQDSPTEGVSQVNGSTCCLTKTFKQKLIKKIISKNAFDSEKQKGLHRQYCRYLTNYLHMQNRLLIQQQIPPSLSILETAEDGDYMEEFTRKDYPHFSNAIQLHELPFDSYGAPRASRVQTIRSPLKLEKSVWSLEDTVTFKWKVVASLVKEIFNHSIKYSRDVMNAMKDRLEERPKIADENYEFEAIADRLGISSQCAKLLFDLLNDYFSLEKDLERTEDSEQRRRRDFERLYNGARLEQRKKLSAKKQILEKLKGEVEEAFRNSIKDDQILPLSDFVPIQERYLSLRELRLLLLQLFS